MGQNAVINNSNDIHIIIVSMYCNFMKKSDDDIIPARGENFN